MQSIKALVVISILIAAVHSGSCSIQVEKIEGFGDSYDEPVLHVMNKLESYALGFVRESSVTIDELRAAYKQYKSWNAKGRDFMIRELPLMRLFVDFALIPMDKYELQVVDEEDKEFKRMYIKRMELAYKQFRKGFLGRYVDEGSYYRSPKTDTLIASLIQAKGHEALTKKLFDDAKLEINAHLSRLYEMETLDDLYSELEQFKFLLNDFNRGNLIALINGVLPYADELDKPRGERTLRDRYSQALRKKNFAIGKDREGFGRMIFYGSKDSYP